MLPYPPFSCLLDHSFLASFVSSLSSVQPLNAAVPKRLVLEPFFSYTFSILPQAPCTHCSSSLELPFLPPLLSNFSSFFFSTPVHGLHVLDHALFSRYTLCFPTSLLFFFNLFYLFIYFWLCWVFVAAWGLSLVTVSGGYSSLWCAGFSLRWLLLLRSLISRCTGFSSCGSRALERRLSSCGTRA